MAVFNVNIDNSPVRFDSGSLFGGMYERMDVEDSAIIKGNPVEETDPSTLGKYKTITNLIQTNSAYSLKTQTEGAPPGTTPTSLAAEGTYRLIWQGKHLIKERWDGIIDNDGEFQDLGNTFESPTGESVSSDYKLDWTKAQFASIAFQVPSLNATPVWLENPITGNVITDWSSWTTIREVATTSSYLDLPFRSNEYDKEWVGDKREDYLYSINSNPLWGQKEFENAFEYQSVVFNWQYPFGTTNAQYLFGSDLINGSRNDDVIRGYAGDDVVRGNAGNDLLYGDYGRDQLFGGPGNDVLVFGGSSSSWDVANFKYRSSSPELAVGGSGSDFFVFRPSEIMWTARDDVYYDMHLPNLYTGKFKYKKLSDVALNNSTIINGPSTEALMGLKLAPNGDIFNSSMTTKIGSFSAASNPFQKLFPIELVIRPTAGKPSESSIAARDVNQNFVEVVPSGNTINATALINDNNFFLNEKNEIIRIPKNNPAANSVVQKSSAFAKDSPYPKFNDLKANIDIEGTISVTGVVKKSNPYSFIDDYFMQPLQIKDFGVDVTLDQRIQDGQETELETYFHTSDTIYKRLTNDDWHYNPFMSQNQHNAFLAGGATAATDPGNGLSNLTQRIRVQDFKIGSDTLDLSAFGLTNPILAANSVALSKLTGTKYIAELSKILEAEGLMISAAKTAWTSGNTSLFIKEKVDTNSNNNPADTLLEIQLVGINISSINGRFFGELPSETAANMSPDYLTY